MRRLMRLLNHEIWKVCGGCGAEFDIRRSRYCEDCGHGPQTP
jgi:rRNA maturation endonuclease Nob1